MLSDGEHAIGAHEWYTARVHQWEQKEAVPHALISPSPILGDPDGEGSQPRSGIVHLDALDEFSREDKLILWGRKGTGKTTILREMARRANDDYIKGYAFAAIVPTHGLLLVLSASLRSSSLSSLLADDITHSARRIWRWVATVAPVVSYLRGRDQSQSRRSHAVALLEAYLDDINSRWRYQPISDWIDDTLQDIMQAVLGRNAEEAAFLARDVRRAFSEPVVDELRRLFTDCVAHERGRGNRMLVLFDTGEIYTPQDQSSLALLRALLDEAYSAYTSRGAPGALSIKAALPSELMPHLLSDNPGKKLPHYCIIHWSQRSIVELIGRRLAFAVSPTAEESVLERMDELGRREVAYRILPEIVHPRQDFPFDTLAYFVRHTLQTPRQAINLMNSILSEAQHRHGTWQGPLAETELRGSLHRGLEYVVLDALAMYRSSFSEVETFVQRVLGERQSIFLLSDLQNWLRDVRGISRGLNMTSDEAITLLLRMGVIGIASQVSQRDSGPYSYAVVHSQFQYQVKAQLTPSSQSVLVTHPAFYHFLRSAVDTGSFVYPEPAENVSWERVEEEDRETRSLGGMR